MNVRDQLKSIIGDDETKLNQIMSLMNSATPMAKYRQSEKGKLKQKAAVERFRERKLQTIEAEGTTSIRRHLEWWADEKRGEMLADCDEEPEQLPKVVVPITELWNDYTDREYTPQLKRSQYNKLFPGEFKRCNSYVDGMGNKHYSADCVIVPM